MSNLITPETHDKLVTLQLQDRVTRSTQTFVVRRAREVELTVSSETDDRAFPGTKEVFTELNLNRSKLTLELYVETDENNHQYTFYDWDKIDPKAVEVKWLDDLLVGIPMDRRIEITRQYAQMAQDRIDNAMKDIPTSHMIEKLREEGYVVRTTEEEEEYYCGCCDDC